MSTTSKIIVFGFFAAGFGAGFQWGWGAALCVQGVLVFLAPTLDAIAGGRK